MSFISINQLSKTFKQGAQTTSVLENATYKFDQKNTVAITGVSGTGKSTLLHILAGFDSPSSGQVFFNEQDIFALEGVERQRFLQKEIGFLFQSPFLIAELSVIENVMIKGLLAKEPYKEAHEKAAELLSSVGLLDKAGSSPVTLSGGEQQRIALARALYCRPSFILADEPTAHLDADTKKAILRLLVTSAQRWQTGLIIATHDGAVAQQMDTVLGLAKGNLIEISATKEYRGSESQVQI